jgi:histidinol-phosphate aminotransferase
MEAYALADLGGSENLTLAQNESAFAPSPAALTAGKEALSRAALYPDPDWRDLCRTIANIHAVDPARILCGVGSMDLISGLIRTFAGPGNEVLGTQYTYLFIAAATAQAQATFVRAAETEFSVSIDRVLEAITADTRIVFICNPANPTGTRIANSEIVRLRSMMPTDVILAIDQAYAEFDDQDHDCINALVERGDTVVLRTLSKSYGLAGARVGWGLFPEAIAAEVRKVLNSNNIPGVSLAMATAAMRDQAYMRDVVARTAAVRDRFADGLRAIGLGVPESHTNFVLIKFPDAGAAVIADRALRASGIVMRGLTGYGLPDCLRATIGPSEVMASALAILTETRRGRNAL